MQKKRRAVTSPPLPTAQGVAGQLDEPEIMQAMQTVTSIATPPITTAAPLAAETAVAEPGAEPEPQTVHQPSAEPVEAQSSLPDNNTVTWAPLIMQVQPAQRHVP